MSPDIGSDIRHSTDGAVATITIDDPARKNPLSRENYLEIIDYLDEIHDSDAKVVVFEGAGDAFTAGGDVDMMEHDLENPHEIEDHVDIIQEHEQQMIERIIDFPLPTVAKMDGVATGDGANLGIACDIPLASERTKISFTHVRFGLTMDTGGAFLLPRLVGRGMAQELALTGKLIDGERANELGLVNHVFPVDEFEERADEIVDQLADNPLAAMKSIKYLVGHGHEWSIEECFHPGLFQVFLIDSHVSEDCECGLEPFVLFDTSSSIHHRIKAHSTLSDGSEETAVSATPTMSAAIENARQGDAMYIPEMYPASPTRSPL